MISQAAVSGAALSTLSAGASAVPSTAAPWVSAPGCCSPAFPVAGCSVLTSAPSAVAGAESASAAAGVVPVLFSRS